MIRRLIIVLCIFCYPLESQENDIIDTFPFEEDFESVLPPVLPAGWETSTNRTEDGDFITEHFQGSNRLSARNATIEQYVITPVFDFTGYRPSTISFIERRSGTFGATIQILYISDQSDTISMGETELTEANTFVSAEFDLPSDLLNKSHVRFVIRVIPDEEGTAGTLRMDNFRIDAEIQRTHDLRITGIHSSPLLPTTQDSILIMVNLLNAGLEPSSGFTVGIQSAQMELLADEYFSDIIDAGDSSAVHLSIAPLLQNIHPLTAYIDYDQNEGTETTYTLDIHITEPIRSFPWHEQFDYANDILPLQWRSSIHNGVSDASLTASVVHEGDRAILMSNATREQFLILPPFKPADGIIRDLSFFERRTGTFDATVYIEVSGNRGEDFQTIATFTHSGETSYVPREIQLDELFPEDDLLYIRIRIAGDGTGGTGTIRFDFFSASIRLKHALALNKLYFEPPLPVTGDNIDIDLSLKNNGLEPASNFTIGVMLDQDILLTERNITDFIESGDSLTIQVSIAPLDQGIHSIATFVEYDVNQTTDTTITAEIHVTDPVLSFPWNERFDYETEGLPVQWRTSMEDTIPDASLTTSIVHEGEQAIVMSDATREQYLILPPFNSSDGLLRELTFFERRSGAFDATLYIEASTDRGIQFHQYEILSHSGETDYVQRTIFLEDWLSENDILYIRLRFAGDGTGTTGTIRFDSFNVSARLNHDLAVTKMELSPPLPFPGENTLIDVTIENQGIEPAANFTLNLYRLTDESDDEPGLIGSYNYTGQLGPSEDIIISFDVENIPPGYSLLRAELDYPPDIQPENNILEEEIFIRYPSRSLIINEILFHTREGQPEFVEIFNPGEVAIDLRDWSIRDRETPGGQINRYTLSDTTVLIGPGSFAVLSADSSIFEWFNLDGKEAHIITANRFTLGLSSLGDEVILLDPSESVVDSVAYDPSWHHPDIFETRGRSLERISPYLESQREANWSSSADPLGGTPGKHNSLFTETPITTANIEVHPNPFSPNADGFEDHTIITYNLPQQTAMVRLRIFDSLGRQVRTLLNNQPSGPEGSVIWDGRNDHGRVARLGIYVILLEAYDADRGGLTQLKSTVVLADRL